MLRLVGIDVSRILREFLILTPVVFFLLLLMQDEAAESEPPQLREVPVLVVCTSGLPRDALVEAEVVGFANNSIPAELFQYRSHISDSTGERQDSTEQAAGEECAMAAVVDSWPVWANSAGSSATVADLPAAVPAVTMPVECGLRVSSSVTQLPRSLCAGFVRVHQADESTSMRDIDIDAAVAVLAGAVRQLWCASQLHRVFLRSVRVYYQPNMYDEGTVRSALATHLEQGFGVAAMVLVPMVCLGWPGQTKEDRGAVVPPVVLAAQVLAADTAQLGTEEWIHVKE